MPSGSDDPGGDPSAGRAPWVAAPVDEASANQRICPFLRSIDDGDRLGVPVEAPDQANRCAALSGPVPQSLRQQELVCLTSGHVNCPRYMRGAMTVAKPLDRVPAAPDRDPGDRRVRPGPDRGLPPVGRVRRRQRRADPDGAPHRPVRPARSWARSRPPAPTATSAAATPLAHRDGRGDRSAHAEPDPGREPDSHAEPDRVAEPHAQSGHHRHPGTDAEADGQAVLEPVRAAQAVPGHARCYVYVIRSGDNLYSIANYFGVPLRPSRPGTPGRPTASRPAEACGSRHRPAEPRGRLTTRAVALAPAPPFRPQARVCHGRPWLVVGDPGRPPPADRRATPRSDGDARELGRTRSGRPTVADDEPDSYPARTPRAAAVADHDPDLRATSPERRGPVALTAASAALAPPRPHANPRIHLDVGRLTARMQRSGTKW